MFMMTSSNGYIFRVTGPLWGKSIGHRGIPITKDSDAKLLCFLWSAPKQTLCKQSRPQWFETLAYYDVTVKDSVKHGYHFDVCVPVSTWSQFDIAEPINIICFPVNAEIYLKFTLILRNIIKFLHIILVECKASNLEIHWIDKKQKAEDETLS